MTSVYFVRHAQSLRPWEDDATRPLTAEGLDDSRKVTELLKTIPVHVFYASPYKRSLDTIAGSAAWFHMDIRTDERFRERKSGVRANNMKMFRRRWADFDYAEPDGECLRAVQNRNMAALQEVLTHHPDENIVIGTHGTALSTMLNYYDSRFQCDGFIRIINYMPYVIRLDFDGTRCVGKEELLIIEKVFKGS